MSSKGQSSSTSRSSSSTQASSSNIGEESSGNTFTSTAAASTSTPFSFCAVPPNFDLFSGYNPPSSFSFSYSMSGSDSTVGGVRNTNTFGGPSGLASQMGQFVSSMMGGNHVPIISSQEMQSQAGKSGDCGIAGSATGPLPSGSSRGSTGGTTGSSPGGQVVGQGTRPAFCLKRLEKERKELVTKPPDNISMKEPQDMYEWLVNIKGAEGTNYENEQFVLRFRFPERYPLDSPEVIFVGAAPVHPHIYSNGHICLSILYDAWSPALSVTSICLSLISMLSSCKRKERPIDDACYVTKAGPQVSPKHMRWIFHDDTV